MTISAIILAHQPDERLTTALKSVTFADQIILLAGNHSPALKSLAAKHHALYLSRPLAGDFSAQRNFALTKATCDWILFLDSDERVTARLQQEIKKAISNSPHISGYYLKRQDVFLGRSLRFGETAGVKLLRLARKGIGSWQRPVHELWGVTGQIGELSQPLIHTPHPSLSSFATKINLYTTLDAGYRHDHHQQFHLWECLIFPPAKFCFNYLLRLGFLDGFPGLVMAYYMSLHSLIVRVKLYEIN